jgi:hypothetical protein
MQVARSAKNPRSSKSQSTTAPLSAIDLSELTKLPGEVDSFSFAMSPDNSIILLRLIRGDEIYELDCRE